MESERGRPKDPTGASREVGATMSEHAAALGIGIMAAVTLAGAGEGNLPIAVGAGLATVFSAVNMFKK
jgi:hypothetical protein